MIRTLSLAFLLSLPAAARADILTYDFNTSSHNFVPGFSDYSTYSPDYSDAQYQLASAYTTSPLSGNAWFISGNNQSDDLFMYFKKMHTGLLPHTSYFVSFQLTFASEAPAGAFGIGGAPGEGVTLKAGASSVEPLTIEMSATPGEPRRFTFYLDKGDQSSPGPAALVLGHIAKPENASPGFALLSRSSSIPLKATTDTGGRLWLFFGTDSGFEGTTNLYYTNFQVTLTPIPEPATLLPLSLATLLLLTRRSRRPTF